MKNMGYIVVILLSLVPLVFWGTMQPIGSRFATTGITTTSLGQICSLVGMVMFSFSFLLSVRAQWLDKLFGGLNRVYVAHHMFGGISFILLLMHPLLLSVAYVKVSFNEALWFLLPGNDWLINLGIGSLMFLMALLIITYYIKLPYHIWKQTHKLLGIAYILGVAHTLLIPTDITYSLPLKIYMTATSIMGVSAYIYWTILGKYTTTRYKYQVSQIIALKNEVVQIFLKPVGNKSMAYASGQFVFVRFKNSALTDDAHPFSLSSPANSIEIHLTVKPLGDFTSKLKQLTVGTIAEVQGPYGAFLKELDNNKGKQVWIAGGIGITPFYSRAGEFVNHPPEYPIDLYYSVKNDSESVFLQELQHIASKCSQFKVFPYFSQDHGRLSAEKIMKISNNNMICDFFICGPPPMMYSLRQQLKQIGIDRRRIHSEEFNMV